MALVDINWKPSDRDLRIFAGLQWLFFGVIAWSVWKRHDAATIAAILMTVSTLIAAVGLSLPQWIRPVYVGWMVAVFPIGWVVSHAILGAVYFLVFTPIGWLLRGAGYDPMERRWDRTATTYWKRRPAPPETRRYFRQF
jgi:hypothetical protein